VLQKSFCGMGLKFSEAWARRLNNDVGDHVATRQTHRRFWQRVCGSIERRLSLVSFFGENLAAAAFGTFATLSGVKRKSDFTGKHALPTCHRAWSAWKPASARIISAAS
jgi:hypothetical protein